MAKVIRLWTVVLLMSLAAPSGAQDSAPPSDAGNPASADPAPQYVVPYTDQMPQALPFTVAPFQQFYRQSGHISIPSQYARGRTDNGDTQIPESSRVLPSNTPPYMPAGLVLPVNLSTTISMKAAKAGDPIRAVVTRNVPLSGMAYIPAGTQIAGEVSSSTTGHLINKDTTLNIEFDQLRMPDGRIYNIRAHILNGLGGYGPAGDPNSDTYKRTRMEQLGLRGEMGTAIDIPLTMATAPIYGENFVRGMWSTSTISGAVGVLGNCLFKRTHNDLIIPSGANLQVQLEQSVALDMPTNQSATNQSFNQSPGI
jgi:hypothetical protein